MQVKSIADCSKGEHSAIFSTSIKLPFVIKIFVLSIFEWPFYTGFTVYTLGNHCTGCVFQSLRMSDCLTSATSFVILKFIKSAK